MPGTRYYDGNYNIGAGFTSCYVGMTWTSHSTEPGGVSIVTANYNPAIGNVSIRLTGNLYGGGGCGIIIAVK